jgi:drug/metabolite transporter (DMT)-like permease
MDAMAKLLIKHDFDPSQILALRSWIILSILFVYYLLRGQLKTLKTKRPIAHVLRGSVGFIGAYCFFKSLVVLPLADATVVFFSSTFIITALSALLLKEKVGVYRWVALVVGFMGVLIAMNPNGESPIKYYLLCLLGSFCYAVYFISGRWLSKTESVASLVFSFNLCMALICSVLASFIWVPIEEGDYASIMLFTFFALIGHYCVTFAFSHANVSVIAPFEYTALIWALLWGYFFWGDIPQVRVWVGATIIISCALFVMHREALAKKPKIT